MVAVKQHREQLLLAGLLLVELCHLLQLLLLQAVSKLSRLGELHLEANYTLAALTLGAIPKVALILAALTLAALTPEVAARPSTHLGAGWHPCHDDAFDAGNACVFDVAFEQMGPQIHQKSWSQKNLKTL